VLLGSVALGALYCGDADTAARYMDESRSHVRDCFDAVLPETVACFVLLVLYFLQSLDNERVFRYMGFAQQAFAELSPQVRVVTRQSVMHARSLFKLERYTHCLYTCWSVVESLYASELY
jgi:hypothetical protein